MTSSLYQKLRGIFSSIYCEDLTQFLEVKFINV